MIEIGRIVNTHGIKGEVKLLAFMDVPEDIEAFYELKYKIGNEYKNLTIENIRYHKGAVLIKFKEINNLSEAEIYKGITLYSEREDMPELADGEYYISDLLGIRVLTDTGELGVIGDVLKTGSNDVYVVKDSDGKEYLIPAIRDVVREINLKEKYIFITPLDGLLD